MKKPTPQSIFEGKFLLTFCRLKTAGWNRDGGIAAGLFRRTESSYIFDTFQNFVTSGVSYRERSAYKDSWTVT